jgi:hypothetical protein
MTIAGQTAPGDGICFKNQSIKLSGDNLIIRYLRFRPGDIKKAQVSCLNIENTRNIIVDHCSMSWSIEENMGFYDNRYTTVQYCILSESLYDSYHSKGPRGYAAQWGGQYASYHYNLLAHHNSRSPRVNGSKSNDTIALCDYRNNVIFNYANRNSIYGGDQHIFMDTNSDGNNDAGCFVNFVNNYLKPGPAYSGSMYLEPYGSVDSSTVGYAEWYIDGNVIEGYNDVTADNWLGVDGDRVYGIDNIKVSSEHEVESIPFYTAQDAYDLVLSNAGAVKPIRDAVDLRILGQVKGDSTILDDGIIDSQSEVGGWPTYETPVDDSIPNDTDSDGMPDYWENENNLDPDDPEDGKIITSSGYSNLENYLNSDIPYISPDNSEDPNNISERFNKQETLIIFPNPCKNTIILNESQNIERIEVYSLDGVLVYETKIKYSQIVNIEGVSKGVYVVKATSFNNKYFTSMITVL